MEKSIAEISYFENAISRMLINDNAELLTVECRKYKIPSAYVIDILKYIYPDIRQTSRIPKIVIKWIDDEYLIDRSLKEKNLEKIPDNLKSKYSKYRVGREIKVRYRFRDKPKKYQSIKLRQLYLFKLYRYLIKKGYNANYQG